MNAEKWHHSEISIAINDESQGSIAKNLRCDELLYYTFIIHSAGDRIFKIGEHLVKLQATLMTVSYTPFALHSCPQRCRSHQISWITCVLQAKTVIKRCYVNRQIEDWRHQWLTDCWSCTAFCRDSLSLLRQLCTVGHGIFYMADVNNFLLVN